MNDGPIAGYKTIMKFAGRINLPSVRYSALALAVLLTGLVANLDSIDPVPPEQVLILIISCVVGTWLLVRAYFAACQQGAPTLFWILFAPAVVICALFCLSIAFMVLFSPLTTLLYR